MRQGTIAACLTVTAALALGACGDGGDSGGGGGEGDLARAELNERAGAICREGDRRLEAIGDPDLASAEAAAKTLTRVTEVTGDTLERLRALEPEAAVEAKYEAYLAAVARGDAFFRRILGKARANDGTGATELARELRTGRLEKEIDLAAVGAGLTICADDSKGGSTASADEEHGIEVVYDDPRSPEQAQAKELLELGGTTGVAEGFSKSFAFPVDITIHARNTPGSPSYDPSTRTVNLFYDFVSMTGRVLRKGQPGITDRELGKQLAAVDGFILVHELGHAFIDVFEIPITGRKEDSADGLATTFMADSVENGAEYAFDAARFFKLLQDGQGTPDARQFADEHSLSIQRALDIVCKVAGSDESELREIGERNLLPPERLRRCPAEYAQTSRAWRTLLRPHLRSPG